MPKRIQLSRKAGSRLPPNTVIVARPSKWGNPYKVGAPDPQTLVATEVLGRGLPMSPTHAVYLFRRQLDHHGTGAPWAGMRRALHELRGKNLACWCPLPREGEEDECHAAVLLEFANRPRDKEGGRG